MSAIAELAPGVVPHHLLVAAGNNPLKQRCRETESRARRLSKGALRYGGSFVRTGDGAGTTPGLYRGSRPQPVTVETSVCPDSLRK